MISKLKESREAAGYSIEEVANKLNIRKRYLIALEEEDYELIPGKIYVEGYTKMYYEFLGMECPRRSRQPLLENKIANNGYAIRKNNKYKKYIILASVMLLIVIVMFYNFLKNPEAEELTSQKDGIKNESDEEIIGRSYSAN